jgi:uncharacterized repeat protein (TIGR02543 family)
MATFKYTIVSGCDTGLTQKHSHSALISDINNSAKNNNNIPRGAVISSARVVLVMSHNGGLGSADLNVWLCNNESDNSGENLISDSTNKNDDKTYQKDISSKITKTYPFTFNTSYPRIAVYYKSTTHRNYRDRDFYVEYTYSVPTYTVTVNAGIGGEVSGGGTYQNQTTATLTATPKPGYNFVKWSDGNDQNPRNVTVTGNASYSAVFEVDKIYVIYDSLFSFKRWKETNLASNSFISVSNVTDIGFTATGLVDDAYTGESRPLIPVEIGRWYTIEFEASGGGFELFVFNCDAEGVWQYSNPMLTVMGNTKKFNFEAVTNYISIRCDVVGTGAVVNFSNFRIYPADCPYMSNTVSKTERTDVNSWSMPTPTREGYRFLGWYTQPNGGGTKYTSSSGFPTSDLVLYSHWELQKYTIDTLATNGIVSGGGAYEFGTSITLTASPAVGYKFEKWSDGNTQNPRVITVTGDATYEAQFRRLVLKFKTVKIYYPSENDIASPTNPLVSGEKAQIVVQVALE